MPRKLKNWGETAFNSRKTPDVQKNILTCRVFQWPIFENIYISWHSRDRDHQPPETGVNQGLVNVQIEHHPSMGDIISNRYCFGDVKPIPKKGHFPTLSKSVSPTPWLVKPTIKTPRYPQPWQSVSRPRKEPYLVEGKAPWITHPGPWHQMRIVAQESWFRVLGFNCF